MKLFAFSFVLAASACVAADGDVALSTDTGGWVNVPADEAKVMASHWKWLDERLTDAKSIKAGSSFADLTKLFVRDGGLSRKGEHRYRLILAPSIKVQVEFVGIDRRASPHPMDPKTKIATISKPYLEPPYID